MLTRSVLAATLAFGLWGCKPDQTTLNSDLVGACTVGDVATARSLLESGANPNSIDKDPNRGFSALVLSITSPVLLDLLLSEGANPNLADANGLLPLSYAVSGGDVDSVKVLVAYGAKVDMQEPNDG